KPYEQEKCAFYARGRPSDRANGRPPPGRPDNRAPGRLGSRVPVARATDPPGVMDRAATARAPGPVDAGCGRLTRMDTTHTTDQIGALRDSAPDELAGRIITVMSGKGGVGKTLLSMELAYCLDAVLLDLDWDGGGATRALGYLHERYQRAPLLDALDTGKPPRPKRMSRRPDLVPSHPDLEANQPEATDTAGLVTSWAQHWGRPVVCDTHPGGSPATLGACAAADLVVMPVILGTRELNALEQTLDETAQYPLLLVPNWD